jgi:hypothetical protein
VEALEEPVEEPSQGHAEFDFPLWKKSQTDESRSRATGRGDVREVEVRTLVASDRSETCSAGDFRSCLRFSVAVSVDRRRWRVIVHLGAGHAVGDTR